MQTASLTALACLAMLGLPQSALARCPVPGEAQIAILWARDTAAASMVSSSSFHGDWVAALSVGLPFHSTLRGQVGVCDWTITAEARTTLDGQVSPAVGLARDWLHRGGLLVSGELLAGAQLGGGAPAAGALEGRIRVARLSTRWTPYLNLATRYAIGLDNAQVLTHTWQPLATLGLGWGLRDRYGLDLGLDVPWNSGNLAFGGHLGLIVKGGVPRRPQRPQPPPTPPDELTFPLF